ncbi:MAG TPA: arabinofuranosidase catalytic domain-containing protein [Polyangia bacterium]
MRNAQLVAAAGFMAAMSSCTLRTGLDSRWGGGGTPGAGGSLGPSSTVVTGGATGTGGRTDTGGAVGTGGRTNAGGASGTGGQSGSGGVTATGGATASALPCDIYAADNAPCVAAHSTVRALYGLYNGSLYQVMRADGATKDIGVLATGGFANSADQDAFCGTSGCRISILYDQSRNANHLTNSPSILGGKAAKPSDAKALPLTINGHKVYGVHLPAGAGFGSDFTQRVAMGDSPETIYMIAGGDYYNDGCCFDYGNVETNMTNDNWGATEAVYFGNCTQWGMGAGSGPWVMADLGGGLWAGNTSAYTGNTSVSYKFVTAMVKGDSGNHWAIKAGNAQAGGLTTMFDGPRPATLPNPMRKQGAIALSIFGQVGNAGQGNFFEGVMTAGYSSDAADDAVQANVVAVYSQ